VPKGWEVRYSVSMSGEPHARYTIYRHDIDRHLSSPIYVSSRQEFEQIPDFSEWFSPQSLSPDNRYLVQSVALTTGSWAIYLIDTSTNEYVPLDMLMRDISWSPDGEFLAYNNNDLEAGLFTGFDDLETLEHIPLDNFNNVSNFLWSNDNRSVMFSAIGEVTTTGTASNGYDIYVFSIEDRTSNNITQTPDLNEYLPVWSADNHQIVYAIDTSGSRQFYLHTLESGEIIQLPIPHTDDTLKSWSPNGEDLLFFTKLGVYFDFGMYLMSLDGQRSNFTSIVINVALAPHTFWSPDGQRIVVHEMRYGGVDELIPTVIDIDTGDSYSLTQQSADLLP